MDLETIKKMPTYVGEVPSTALNMLPNTKKGDIIITSDEPYTAKIYDGKKWIPFENNNPKMTLYDLNKAFFGHKEPLSPESAKKEIEEKIHSYLDNTNSEFHMLYGRDINYFTVFQTGVGHQKVDAETLGEALEGCLSNIGQIFSIDLMNDNNLEIWINTLSNGVICLYLFPYDNGVVKVRW